MVHQNWTYQLNPFAVANFYYQLRVKTTRVNMPIFFLYRSRASYSDGCCGQNKNLTIIGFYNEMHQNRVYERIDHKYLERGHTYLENDRDFAQIEKRKKTATVYLPQDWVEAVRDSMSRSHLKRQQCSQKTSLIGKVL